ncbi:MAG: NAD(P)/FAD-dependent oxidoreductase [Myxococcota bacterium]
MAAQTERTGSGPDASKRALEAARARYRRERDRRLRQDGNAQYGTFEGRFARLLDDPFVEPGFTREPIAEALDVVVVGGGFSGLCTGARLRQAGAERLRMIETGGDFGGTWYWNRYPGAQCDIESYVYLPMLEELGTMPSLKYAYGPEIFAHAQRIGRHFDLYRGALFQTRVTRIEWDEPARRWRIGTSRGDDLRARFVVVANGPLSRPKLPGIPGLPRFEGKLFHTSRWDYAYTGGDTNGGLVKLRDKRVGVIGTGATAIQCIPHLGEHAERLTVFQRTPSSVDARRNAPTDSAWVASLRPGWQAERIANFSTVVSGGLATEDLVADGWTDIIRNLSGLAARTSFADLSPEALAEQVELADLAKMDEIRARVDRIVRDPETAEALKPWYRQFCKRPCFHDDYLATFNRENVTLVDTGGRGVEAITPNGVLAGGRAYALDCLILATGFEVGTDYARRADCEIVGRDGVTLTQKWSQGIRTFHGLTTRGFPNCFLLGGMQSGVTPNFTELYDQQSRHIAWIVGELGKRGLERFETSEAAEADWVRVIRESTMGNPEFSRSCTPGYYNNEGRPDEGPGWFGGSFGGGAQAFFALLRSWRERGALEGLELA